MTQPWLKETLVKFWQAIMGQAEAMTAALESFTPVFFLSERVEECPPVSIEMRKGEEEGGEASHDRTQQQATPPSAVLVVPASQSAVAQSLSSIILSNITATDTNYLTLPASKVKTDFNPCHILEKVRAVSC